MPGPIVGDDGLARCPWAAGHPVNRDYHDTEWGMPIQGEAAHLERLTLEAFQSGLSWLTILNKRPAFRAAFADFDADVVAAYDDADRARLMADAGIVRNRLKVDAAITNARATVALRDEGGLAAFVETLPARGRPGAADDRGDGDDLARVDRPVEGPEEEGFRLRRADHDVRPDGGHRHRRRPPRRLPPTRVRHAGIERGIDRRPGRFRRFREPPRACVSSSVVAPLAQSAERLHGKEKVYGSIP